MEREDGVYEYEIESKQGLDIRRPLNKLLSSKGWPILMMKPNDLTLEDVFLKITMNDTEDSGEKVTDAQRMDAIRGIKVSFSDDEEKEKSESSSENNDNDGGDN
jgi:ABC-2 type transport system ATP-binding protein